MPKKLFAHGMKIGLLLLIISVAMAGTAFAAADYLIDYTIRPWTGGGTGASVDVKITNMTATPVVGWELKWAFEGGETLGGDLRFWNVASVTQSGANVTAVNPASAWNGTIPANGGTVTFGFNIAGRVVALNSLDFTLNGKPCGEKTTPGTGGKYDVIYTITNQWKENGTDKFRVQVTIKNLTSTPVNGWTAVWTFKGNEVITATDGTGAGKHVNYSQSGKTITVTPNQSWNTVIPANGSINFGLFGTGVAQPMIGIDFTINGQTAGQKITIKKLGNGNGTVTVTGGTLAQTCEADCMSMIVPFLSGTSYTFQATTDASSTVAGWMQNGQPVSIASVIVQPDDVLTVVFNQAITHVENPFDGAVGYVSPQRQKTIEAQAAAETDTVLAAKMRKVGTYPGAIWIDRVAAIAGDPTNGIMGLRDHLNAALAQQTGATPVVITVVVYDIPIRDCAALASAGEFKDAADMALYQTTFVDPIMAILRDPLYASLRIAVILEPDSLPNMVSNLGLDDYDLNDVDGKTDELHPDCNRANNDSAAPTSNKVNYTTNIYVQGIRYGLDQLETIPNAYTYLDISHAAWVGWNLNPGVDVFKNVLLKDGVDPATCTDCYRHIDGFVSNISGYSITEELYFAKDGTKRVPNAATVPAPVPTFLLKGGDFYANSYWGEREFVTAFRNRSIIKTGTLPPLPEGIGMLIDTSRNGWGPDKSAPDSSITDATEWTKLASFDRRFSDGNTIRGAFCNQKGAGIGMPQTAYPYGTTEGIDAFVWIKPSGDSDGTSDPTSARFDQHCNPTAVLPFEHPTTKAWPTNAMENAPEAGQWFPEQFRELVQNANPPIAP